MVTRVGYFLGSLGGGILIDRINQEFLLGTATLFLGLIYALTPWAFHVHALVALQLLRGINSGILEAGMYPRSGQIWSENTENRYCIGSRSTLSTFSQQYSVFSFSPTPTLSEVYVFFCVGGL